MKNTLRIGAIAAASALALAACSSAPDDKPVGTSAAATTTSAPETVDFKACMVSDAGGFDDGSFNQSGFEGLERAAADLGIEIATAESNGEDQFAPNVEAMVDANCDLIITVGFALSTATVESALANPGISYAIVDDFADNDFNGETDAPNIKPLTFQTDEAAFLAGYAAASVSTGTVATFGGVAYPSVTIFMDGFLAGANAFNADSGKNVAVLGWDGKDGAFTGDFKDLSKGQTTAQGFIDQGADIILPVAGPVGAGAAAAAQAAGGTWIVGVDADWTVTYPEYTDIIFTSILKNIGNSVFDTISEAVSDAGLVFTPYVGTLENGGVSLAPFAAGTVSPETETKLAELTKGIIAGDIKVNTAA